MHFSGQSRILGIGLQALLFLFTLLLSLEYVESRPGGGSSSRSRSSSSSSISSNKSSRSSSRSSGSFSSGSSSRSSNSHSSGSASYSNNSSSSNSSSPSSNSYSSSSPASSHSSSPSGSSSRSRDTYSSSSSSSDFSLFYDYDDNNSRKRGSSPFIFTIVIFFSIVPIGLLLIRQAIYALISTVKAETTVVRSATAIPTPTLPKRRPSNLDSLLTQDPNFSKVLFLDYVQILFHQYYQSPLRTLKPFFALNLPNQLDYKYREVVINAMHIEGFYETDEDMQIDVFLDTNLSRHGQGRQERILSEQRWTLTRRKGLVSLQPERLQTISCPNCGASNSFDNNYTCKSCASDIAPKQYQWAVNSQQRLYEESYQSDNLVTYEEERGTNLPTIYDPKLSMRRFLFTKKHQISSFDSYFQGEFVANTVHPFFTTIYQAWETKRWGETRHLLSDFLYQTQNFWMEEYRSKGYTNKLDDLQIQNIQLAKIDMDAFYESFTVRIYAACKDYTIEDKTGQVIGGDPRNLRHYSEYWTFIRRIGQEKPAKDSFDLKSCPACAAPLDKMGMAGICGYCDNKVTTGEFSWVLSRITQDEVYSA